MPFRKLFGRGNGDEAEPQPAAEEEEEIAEEGSDDDAQSPEQALDADAVDLDWRSRATDVIPGGTSTGSKRCAALRSDVILR